MDTVSSLVGTPHNNHNNHCHLTIMNNNRNNLPPLGSPKYHSLPLNIFQSPPHRNARQPLLDHRCSVDSTIFEPWNPQDYPSSIPTINIDEINDYNDWYSFLDNHLQINNNKLDKITRFSPIENPSNDENIVDQTTLSNDENLWLNHKSIHQCPSIPANLMMIPDKLSYSTRWFQTMGNTKKKLSTNCQSLSVRLHNNNTNNIDTNTNDSKPSSKFKSFFKSGKFHRHHKFNFKRPALNEIIIL
ncbi:hypothetical protein DASC09_004080 [Saccharomycopsis crataegensis]|uniref:Uncharacterized protein n=1 Tax=Saccharomycopsis crataegensis TaxID=43959 RepID=A0AAV5QEA4_9ASCO|nr:hypothetical protein DASC09_004080 [Saccharomycopsis crataegensis]